MNLMKDWHRSDIFDALIQRGWEGPVTFEVSSNEASYVGEGCSFRRSGGHVQLFFVADIGTGFTGPESIEAVVAKPTGGELWLHRTRDSKWKRQLLFWANRVSGMALPEAREPNLPLADG